ncbi:hypothetical protein FVEG_14672 [Fusarium verticillioides 7600]|uniref:Uncharacterized protein n=1 Tax=Gibberella moniliformis (strain M3125 / FGSC 7600) TaxID=334819 RepID=W7LLU7_GIBM7|nr:hypothetical protein FVEG_14672 [Fusarium verticillioides 7600]EWG36470.1 hypothetical protein FVEG_14672 [Fusarium verticillioides 7600]
MRLLTKLFCSQIVPGHGGALACFGEARGAAGCAVGISMQHGSYHRGLLVITDRFHRSKLIVPALMPFSCILLWRQVTDRETSTWCFTSRSESWCDEISADGDVLCAS